MERAGRALHFFTLFFFNHLRIFAGFSTLHKLPILKCHCCENRAGTELPLKLPVTSVPSRDPRSHPHGWVSGSNVSQKIYSKTHTGQVSTQHDIFLGPLPQERRRVSCSPVEPSETAAMPA